MMEDARAGKIDLIITKSVSRFARNTAVLLKATRELKDMGIGVQFELQNINTLSGEGELMLTVLAAFAQAESVSGSVGAKMVYQRKYEAGIPVQYLERSYGYRKNEKGEFVPDPDEAVWVKKIYRMAADGYTPAAIRRYLNNNDLKTVEGVQWCDSTVSRILQNEIYKGDYIMHKYFVNEERKLVPNRGEVDAWYIENDHTPIVSKELWNKAQEALNRKREYLAQGSFIADFTEENYPYMNHLFCGKCGHPLYHRVYSKGNRLSWDCSGVKRYGTGFCEGVNVPDGVVREWGVRENVYIMEEDSDTGKRQYRFLKEASWKRRHKKKVYEWKVPDLNETNYPFLKKIYCAKCGQRLVRLMAKGDKVFWVCEGKKRKGNDFCTGIRVPEEEMRKMNLTEAANYISERRLKNGKKCYSHSGKKQECDNQQQEL
jgi:DNA invertase Pin-like site-specific DNA recombinase